MIYEHVASMEIKLKYLSYTLSPLNKISDYKIWDPFKKLVFYFIGN